MSKMDADKAYANAQDLIKKGDYGQAKMMLTIALHKDPENEHLKAALEEVKAKAAAAPAQKSAAPAPMMDLSQAMRRAPSGIGGDRVEAEAAAPAKKKGESKRGVVAGLVVVVLLGAALAVQTFVFPTTPGEHVKVSAKVGLADYQRVMAVEADVSTPGTGVLKLSISRARFFGYPPMENQKKVYELWTMARRAQYNEMLIVDAATLEPLAGTEKGQLKLFATK